MRQASFNMDATKESLGALLHSPIAIADKLVGLHEVFFDEDMRQLASCENFGDDTERANDLRNKRKELFAFVADWLLSLQEVPDRLVEDYCDMGEIACAVAEFPEAWVSFKKLKVKSYIDKGQIEKARGSLIALKELLPDDEDVLSTLNLLNEVSEMMVLARRSPKNGCDNGFYELTKRLKDCSVDKLLSDATNSALRILDDDHEYFGLLLKWYRSWYGVGALHHGDQGFVNYFDPMYSYLKQQREALESLYEGLGDYRSKLTLKTILQHWLTFTPDIRKSGIEGTFKHYFDLDIMRCTADEVFVDCGAYTGDSVRDFIEQYAGQYRSIYAYELTPSIFEKARENLKGYRNVFLRNKGVSDHNGEMSFIDTIDAGNRLVSNGGNATAQVVRMDNDIREDISFIKMDIEGAEIAALIGAQNHIRRSRPKLAISLYHKLSDLIDIPRLCKELVPEYRFYLRHHPADFPFPTEYVLLAVAD